MIEFLSRTSRRQIVFIGLSILSANVFSNDRVPVSKEDFQFLENPPYVKTKRQINSTGRNGIVYKDEAVVVSNAINDILSFSYSISFDPPRLSNQGVVNVSANGAANLIAPPLLPNRPGFRVSGSKFDNWKVYSSSEISVRISYHKSLLSGSFLEQILL